MSALSTIIATLDEELHIGRSVASVGSLGPVFVVDAGSSDATVECAQSAGATVVEHSWEGYSAQKNWALEHLPIETEWVLFLDADEVVTEELAAEIRASVAGNDQAGYYIPRRNRFFGRDLRHAWWYPDYQLRLFRTGSGRFEQRLVHEHVMVDGGTGFLDTPLLHDNLKSVDAFIMRHLRYAAMEAAEIRRARKGRIGAFRGSMLGTWPERRRALKTRIWYRLPFRPVVRFVWIYLVKRGFLDGRPGLLYASLLTMYEIVINATLAELELGDAATVGAVGDDRLGGEPLPQNDPSTADGCSIATIIATLDEELHIARSVSSARRLGPVFVVDAGSSDATVALAEAAGATVVEHPWEGYSAQKNWALDNLPTEADWVLFLDADEYVPPRLAAEIRSAVRREDANGFYLPEMNVFMGTELKHAWWYPAYQLRLFRRAVGRWEARDVHESVVVDGQIDFLQETLYHENLKGVDVFAKRHLRYSSAEAEEMLRARREGWGAQRRGRLLGSWPERRRFLKVRVWYRIPGRPVVRFVWLYVIRRGFLDGRAGRVYCALLVAYEIMINAQLAELELLRPSHGPAVESQIELRT